MDNHPAKIIVWSNLYLSNVSNRQETRLEFEGLCWGGGGGIVVFLRRSEWSGEGNWYVWGQGVGDEWGRKDLAKGKERRKKRMGEFLQIKRKLLKGIQERSRKRTMNWWMEWIVIVPWTHTHEREWRSSRADKKSRKESYERWCWSVVFGRGWPPTL